MTSRNAEQVSRHRSIQILLAIFSVIFVALIAYGYYHLLLSFGWFIAAIGGALMAALAWYLAKVAGTSDGGIAKNFILVIPLFVISAAGIYNSMMVFLEGEQVLADTASDAQASFAQMESTAQRQLAAEGITKRANQIYSNRDALISEINNPLNCGQGPEARRLIGELQRELPEFKPLSGARNCEQNAAVVKDYNDRIDALIARASWNNPELNAVATGAANARGALGELRQDISREYSANKISQIGSIFEEFETQYQDLLVRLGRHAEVENLPDRLDITSAQSLGNVYRLPALFFNRLGNASTWVYLLIALGIDLFLAYLFQLAARTRVRKAAIAGPIAGAW